MISGNERLLKMLLSNLIDNSCKFSVTHKVVIRIAYNSSSVTLRFINQGIGIPEEDLGHIFEPLYRASNVISTEGHGIGLSIVKRIADMHNANITILSELNIGTTISVSFPVAGGFSPIQLHEFHHHLSKRLHLHSNGIFRFKFRRDCTTYK